MSKRVSEAEQKLEADPWEGESVSWGNSKVGRVITSSPSHKVPPKSLPRWRGGSPMVLPELEAAPRE